MATFFSPSAASMVEGLPKKRHQVFINFRGELRNSFISHLEAALANDEINYYIGREETWSQDIKILFDRIDESDIALVVFSKRYSESKWCLNELAKIMENAEAKKLRVIPVFFDVRVDDVKHLKGEFGLNFYAKHHGETTNMQAWKGALRSAVEMRGLILANYRSESDLIVEIVASVKDVIATIDGGEGTNTLSRNISSLSSSGNSSMATPPSVFINFRGAELRNSFVDHLTTALEKYGVKVYVGDGDPANPLFHEIEESRIALVIFSRRYTESIWSLEELVKIKELVEKGKLVAVPVFYYMDLSEVKALDGDFGFNLWNHVKRTSEFDKLKKWKEALDFVSQKSGHVLNEERNESDFVSSITVDVQNVLSRISPHYQLSEKHGDALMDSSGSDNLKGVDGERDSILWDTKSDVNKKEAESIQAETKSRTDDGLNTRKDDEFLGEANFDATFNLQNCAENERVDPISEEKKEKNVSKTSTTVTYNKPQPEHKVYINFRGADLRYGFVGQLVKALNKDGVKVFEDTTEKKGKALRNLFEIIEESQIALVIFSSRYTESQWCLNELVKIKHLMEEGKLLVIPIFYKLESSEVYQLKGDFGANFWNLWRISRDHPIIKWKEALESVASMKGIYSNEHSSESEFITVSVKKVLEIISLQEGESTELSTGKGEDHKSYLNKHYLVGVEQRLRQLEEKLEFDCNETRIIGVVGMPGIGKTTLAMLLHEKWNSRFLHCMPLLDIGKKTKDYGPEWLRKTILEVLLEGKFPVISDKTTHASVKDKLLQSKVFVVLDDVSDKKQLEFLLGDLDWIKKGSKIVITTSDKSLLDGFAHDTYVVPELNDNEAYQLLRYHAFDDKCCSPTNTFMTLSRMFVDYARGHPLALNLLGRELYGKDKAHWEYKLEEVKKKSHMMFQNIWKISTDQLNERQKDVFLDIVCFFKSEDEYFVRSLLDSGDPGATDSASELTDLTDKFLITISDGRVEMNDLLYALSRDLGSLRRLRLRNYEDIINKLKNMELSDAHNVRGIFLDMSKLTKSICLDGSTFINMRNLLYLKIYDSCFPRKCKADCNLVFPEGLEFPLEEVRYLHWVKFPLQELPQDFRPENLVDLRLPYSKIKRVWQGVKDTPRLKWVDLSHSSNLLDLSALSRAENLQRLNLEGCTVLDKLPVEIQNMKSLIFLNLRGCTRLSYLPEMNLISLKTLILSDCLKLEKFQLISESLEVLYLDGTAIKGLPLAIKKLQKLVLLNLKNCKMLERLPNCLRELKALEELILSGCSRLENLSDVRENMKYLQSLLIDRIGAKEMPNISSANILEGHASADMVLQPVGPREWPSGVHGVCSLRRLCLSGNDFVSLQTDIGKLYNLIWLDVKQCKMLRSIPMLPPRLQFFDAHGCDSLERVANPLALPVLSGQIHATFNFSNCNNLDQDAKDSIISYTCWKSQLVLDALSRDNGGSVMEDFTGTCFPGWEVPAWFSHQASGSVLERKLPPHWCSSRFTGIAVCAVIIFPGYYEKQNHLLVKCNCVFNYRDGSHIRFRYTAGSWREPSNTTGKIGPSHVFIGYTSTLDIKKYVEEKETGCSYTEASFEFEVTDGTKVLEGCEVLQCGFSLVYATNERENISWDAKTVVIPERIDNIPGEARSYGNPGSRDDIQYESYSGMGPERDENFICDTKYDATKNLQKSFENKIVDLFNEESDGGREVIVSSDGGGDDPQARKLLGSILCGNKKADWEKKLQSATQSFNMKMRDVLKLSIDQLNERQKDVFLDILFFFKSEDEYFVRSILDLEIPEAVSEVRDLADKFFITISGGRVEMHDLLYTLAKDLGSPWQRILYNCKDIINKVTKMKQPEANNVRGIFLDMSEMMETIALECMSFSGMRNLRYLKIYDSCCPQKCNADCKLVFPEGLKFPLEEVRYLHWVKFPLQELPTDFRPENLVDLRLPYSNIERVWEGVKVTPRLKWVDLCHSSKLVDLATLSKAENLQRLNLEGCTSLDELPVEIQNMKSLVFLNLRGCIRLRTLPKMNLVSLKTLILSDCSNLKEFQLISESVKFLYLDGTAIKGLPLAIQNLHRLVVLNLKNCKMLECLPNCLRKLKFLDELILSGCSRLKNIPDVTNSLKHLQILLLDGIGANEMPSISCFTGSEGSASANMLFQPIGSNFSVREWPCDVNGLSSLRHLCLSGNDFVSLQPDIGKLYNLNWLDVNQCKKLRSVPTLPPRLQYFDAHGCDSLERVANPLALLVLSEQIHATFNFSNCNKLDQDAKDSIITYTRLRSQLMLDELTCYNEGYVLEALIGTCLPGWEIPAWFSHRASGSVLKPKLPPHWSDNRFTGMALCAVILFPSFNEQRNRLLVKCNCVFDNDDGSSVRFSSVIGSWSEPSNTPGKIESSHVFIGYTSTLDFKMYGEEENEKGRGHTEASFEFEVTDGTEVLEGSKVLKCGFSLVYATDDMRVKLGVRRAPVEANQYRAHLKQVAISNVRSDTATAEMSQGVGHEIVELPNKIIAPGNPPNPQRPITTPLLLRKYVTGSQNLRGERHVSTSYADTRLSEEPQELSASLNPTVASSSQAGLRRSVSHISASYPQRPITTPLFPPNYGTGSTILGRERHVSTSYADIRLFEKPQELSASLNHMVASSSQAGLRPNISQIFPPYPQRPITTPLLLRKYGTGSTNLGGERHVSTSYADTRLFEKPQKLSASLNPMVASSSQAGLRRSRSQDSDFCEF